MGFLQEFGHSTNRAAATPSVSPPAVPRQRTAQKSRGFIVDFGTADAPVAQEVYHSSDPIHSEASEESRMRTAAQSWRPAQSRPVSFDVGLDPAPRFGSFLSRTTHRPTKQNRGARPTKSRSSEPISSGNSDGLRRELGSLSSRVSEMGSKAGKAAERAESLEREASTARDRLESAKDRLSSRKEAEARAEEKLRQNKRSVSKLEKKLYGSSGFDSDYGSSFDFELSDLDLKYENGKLTSDSKWRLSDVIGNKRNAIYNLESSLSSARDARQQTEREIRDLQGRLHQLSGERERAVRSSESSRNKKAAMETELQRLQDRYFDVSGSYY